MTFGESDWRIIMTKRKPHRNAKDIKAWADGVDVSCNETRVSVSGNPNARFTFDADTKKLIKAEVIK